MTEAALYAQLSGAALTGLAAGGHCLGMCGGLQAALMPTATPGLWRLQVGRSAAYTLLGAAAGAIGTGAAGLVAPALRQLAALLAVVALLSLAVRLALRRDLLGLERLGAHLWKALQPLARRAGQWREPWRSYGLGMVWAFIPCGLVLSMAALAGTTGAAWHGAALLGAFALGTWPALLGAGFLGRLAGKSGTALPTPGLDWRRWILALALLLLAFAQLALLFAAPEHHHHTGMLPGFRDGSESLTLCSRAVGASA